MKIWTKATGMTHTRAQTTKSACSTSANFDFCQFQFLPISSRNRIGRSRSWPKSSILLWLKPFCLKPFLFLLLLSFVQRFAMPKGSTSVGWWGPDCSWPTTDGMGNSKRNQSAYSNAEDRSSPGCFKRSIRAVCQSG